MNNGPEFDCECDAQVFQREIKMILINEENKKKNDFETGSIDKI